MLILSYELPDQQLRQFLEAMAAHQDVKQYPVFILEHDSEWQTLIQYAETYHDHLEGCLRQFGLQSSRIAYFPSGAHTPLTTGRVNQFRQLLTQEVQINVPAASTLIHSQSARQLQPLLTTSEALCAELIDIMNSPMDMKPMFNTITELSRADPDFFMVEIGSSELETAMASKPYHLSCNPIHFYDPYHPTCHWLNTLVNR